MRIYAALLKLYPPEHRAVFAEEMTHVFHAAEAEVQAGNLVDRAAFYLREFAGLVCGAARERLCEREEFSNEFVEEESMKKKDECRRFPSFSIALMAIIFVIVIAIIAKGDGLSHYLFALQTGRSWDLGKSPFLWPSYWRLVSGIVAGFVIAWLAGLTVWMVAYAMRKTGAQRLGEFQP